MVDCPAVSERDDQGRLSYDQVELVLRRAAEIEQRKDGQSDKMSPGELETLGEEVGLSRSAVREAMVELRTNALVPYKGPPGALDRVFGPARVVVQRTLPVSAQRASHLVARWMEHQLFRVKRNYGDRLAWERTEGFFDSIKRALDLNKSYVLTEVQSVETSVTEVPFSDGNQCSVSFVYDLGEKRGETVKGALAGAGIFAAAGLITAFAADLALPLLLLPAVGGPAIGAGIVGGAASSYRKESEKVRSAFELFLDQIEHEQPF